MPLSVIKGPRELHSVRTPEAYRAAHAKQIAARASTGQRIEVHELAAPRPAQVDWESGWVIECECSAGNSTHPEWEVACCFACGAVHTAITFPAQWRAIERLLLARPLQKQRAWVPSETVEELQAQNRSIGVSDAAE